ncbi:MAG: chitobiase/beta-hexosaminidase C-terminal domain-containing protein [bacterium]|nr:chitobiase/beta-hexosaminidase C-terminal domain-containing protein [bacterium]
MGMGKQNRAGRWFRAGIGLGMITLAFGLLAAGCGSNNDKNEPAALILSTTAAPPGGIYNDAAPPTVTLTANRPAVIYYSVDGRTPGPGRANTREGESPVTGIEITQDTILKFFSIDAEENQEAVKTESYVIDAPPVTSARPSGKSYPGATTVALIPNDPEAATYYTLDGSDPTTSSTRYVSGSPINITHEGFTTLKFFSVDANGNTEEIKTERYRIDLNVPTVTTSPAPGRYLAAISVTLLASESATIYYTVDGSEPSLDPMNWADQGGSTSLANTQAVVSVGRHTRIRYFAVDEVGNPSALQEAIYMIGATPFTQADPRGGNYNQPQQVRLSASTAGGVPAVIYYTTDNTSPDPKDPAEEYIDGSAIPITAQGATVLRFLAVDSNTNQEAENVEVYVIDSVPPVTRALPAGNVYYTSQKITLESEKGATIYYSMDGNAPGVAAANTFSAPSPITTIVINADTILKFFSRDEQGNLETVRTEVYQIFYRYRENFSTADLEETETTTADWNVTGGYLALQMGIPPERGYFTSTAESAGILPADEMIFLADGSAGLRVLDVSYPGDPVLVYTVPRSGLAAGPVSLASWGKYLLAAGAGGLSVLDAGEPRAPLVTGTLTLPGSGTGRALSVSGNYLYLADGSGGARVIRITNPTFPQTLSAYTTGVGGDLSVDVNASGNYLFAAFSQSGLVVLDISNPEATSLPKLASLAVIGALSLARDGNLLLLGTNSGDLALINISNPKNPQLWSTLKVCTQGISSLAIRGILAYLACGSDSLAIVNVAGPESPRKINSYAAFGNLNRIASDGSRVFASNGGGGLRVIGAADLVGNPQVLSGQTLNQARGITLYRNFGYLANGSDGLVALDLTDPTLPALTSVAETAEARASAVFGSALLLADGAGGIKIFDLTYPDSLTPPIGTIATTSAQDLAVSGNVVFVADGAGGVKVFRIINPRYPPASPLATVSLDEARGLSLSGGRLFVADGTEGLVVVNVIDPVHPQAVRTIAVAGSAQMTAARGNYLYLAAGDAGLLFFDISDPDNPLALGSVNLLGAAQVREVKAWGDYLYLVSNRGIEVVNNSYPAQPVYLRTIAQAEARSLALRGDYGFLAAGARGLSVFQLSRETSDYLSPERAQSQNLNPGANDVAQGEVRPAYGPASFGTARFYLSNNGGKTWDEFEPYRSQSFTTRGSDLRFRVDLSTPDPTRTPIIDELVVLYKIAK